MNTQLKMTLGWILIVSGCVGLCALSFFYGVVLFSSSWIVLEKTHAALRLLFSIETGLLVLYASFTALCVPLVLCVVYGVRFVTGKVFLSRVQIALLLTVWICAVLVGFFTTIVKVQQLIDRVAPFSAYPADFDIEKEIPRSLQDVFRTTLKNEVIRTQGVPSEGFTPDMFLKAFSGLTMTDFEDVEASIGTYHIVEGRLTHILDEGKLIHSAANVLTDRSFDTLLANVSVRLGVDLRKEGTLTQIMETLVAVSVDTPKEETVVCTMDAKVCPDGTTVGRVGPSCDFAPCGSETRTPTFHQCTKDERGRPCTREYMPVCGLTQVQCVTTPCPEITETYGNGCSACAQENVASYTEGQCR